MHKLIKPLIVVTVLIAILAVFVWIEERPVSASSASGASPATELHGKVVKAGLFKVIRSGGLVDSKRSSTGKAISKPVIQLVKVTDRIPLVKDAHMSLQYRIWELPDRPAYVDLKRVLRHPPMTLPDGRVSTGSEYMIKGHVSAGQVIAYTGYGLNEDYEMLEGDWTFEIWLGDDKLVSQTFITYWPRSDAAQQMGQITEHSLSQTGS